MAKLYSFYSVLAPKRRVLSHVLNRLQDRRHASADDKHLAMLYCRCFALSKIANGCSYETARKKLEKEGFKVATVTIRAWARKLAFRLAEWQERTKDSQGNRRLSSKELESFLADYRLRESRKKRRTVKRFTALEILDKYASDLPRGIGSWRQWRDDMDIRFFLCTGCISPRLAVEKDLASVSVDETPTRKLWREWSEAWVQAYPDGEDWRQLADQMADAKEENLGFCFRVVPEGNELNVALRTIWTLRKEEGQKTRPKKGRAPIILSPKKSHRRKV